jgi:hypothetical protein
LLFAVLEMLQIIIIITIIIIIIIILSISFMQGIYSYPRIFLRQTMSLENNVL